MLLGMKLLLEKYAYFAHRLKFIQDPFKLGRSVALLLEKYAHLAPA